jgi:hypothetical protein
VGLLPVCFPFVRFPVVGLPFADPAWRRHWSQKLCLVVAWLNKLTLPNYIPGNKTHCFHTPDRPKNIRLLLPLGQLIKINKYKVIQRTRGTCVEGKGMGSLSSSLGKTRKVE